MAIGGKLSSIINAVISTKFNIPVSGLSNWILETGLWNDIGSWIDTDFWNDGPVTWLLSTGSWNDTSVWDDFSVWNDGPVTWLLVTGSWNDMGVWDDFSVWND